MLFASLIYFFTLCFHVLLLETRMAWSQLSQIKVSEIHPGLHSWPVKAKTIQMWTTQDKKDNTRVPYLQLILFDR